MKHLRLIGCITTVLLLSATHLAAQCEPAFSFSVYSDGSVSADGSTVYGYTSTEDTSTLCSCVHSDYVAYAILYAPDGSEIGAESDSGFESSVSALTSGVSGTYEANGAGTAYCSCLQGYLGAVAQTIHSLLSAQRISPCQAIRSFRCRPASPTIFLRGLPASERSRLWRSVPAI